MKQMVAALLAAACCASAQAQEPGAVPVQRGKVFTLAEALGEAESVAPSGALADAGERFAAAERMIAGLRPNPTADVEVENILGSGPYSGVRAIETTASVSWPIEMGGKRSSRIAVADAKARRAAIETAILRADLKLAVTEIYIEAVAAEERMGTAREQVRIAAEAFRAADVRVRAGRASPIEVQRAEVARINADAEAQRAGRNVLSARMRLEQRLDRSNIGPLDTNWFSRISNVHGPATSAGSAGTLAMEAAKADLATAEAQVRLAHSQRLPDVSAGVGGRRFDNGDMAMVFNFSVPLPILNNGQAAIEQAGAGRVQAEARKRAIAIEANDAIIRAQAEVANAAAAAFAASGPALAAAEETARIARIGYREGKFGQLDLLDAERTLAETRAAAIDALEAYHRAEARLARLMTPSPIEGN